MSANRNLPPFNERTPNQHIESGFRLDGCQKLVSNIWDQQILLLKLRGRTPKEISVEVGCSEFHVRKRIPKMLDQQAKDFAEVASLEIVVQLGRLDLLYGQVYTQWEKSCGDAVETATETEGEGSYTTGSTGPLQSVPSGKFKQKNRETRHGQNGDPRLVEQLRAIMADQRKLLRLDKDEMLQDVLARSNFTQININAGDGPMVPITAMTPQALAETADLLFALGMNPDGTVMKKRLDAPETEVDEEG